MKSIVGQGSTCLPKTRVMRSARAVLGDVLNFISRGHTRADEAVARMELSESSH